MLYFDLMCEHLINIKIHILSVLYKGEYAEVK